MADAPRVERLVIKVGSSVLTDAKGHLRAERIQQLTDQVARCAAEHRRPVVVSSGAIACGMARLGLGARPKALAQLQACAAIGQSELMHLYTEAFRRHKLTVGQVLLTQDDFASRVRFRNAKQTLLALLHRHVVPIINENDTVAVEEITFGDNDRLAALVAAAVDAQLLLILSDVDGVLQNGRVVDRVEAPNQLAGAVQASARHTTKGGMRSKLEAAQIAGHSGIPVIVANGATAGIVDDVLSGLPVGTLFVPPRTRLNARKWWIAFALRRPAGTVVIDDGAAAAVLDQGKSLLASGVRDVRGRFDAGTFVAVTDMRGAELARGVSNYSSADLARVRGLTSQEAARRLGQARGREVIHRDHLVLSRELER
jgi:glutamate 5-kinase